MATSSLRLSMRDFRGETAEAIAGISDDDTEEEKSLPANKGHDKVIDGCVTKSTARGKQPAKTVTAKKTRQKSKPSTGMNQEQGQPKAKAKADCHRVRLRSLRPG